MAKRKRRARARVVAPPVVEEEVIEDNDNDEELEDEEELEEEPAPKPKRRRRRKVVEPVEEEEDEGELEEEDEEPAPKPRRKKRKVVAEPIVASEPKKRRKKKVAPEPEPEPEVEVDAQELLWNLLDSMDDGQSITIIRTSDESWTVSSGVVAAGPAKLKLKGKAYYAEVYSPEFEEHQTEWRKLTFAEKKIQAKKLGLKWEAHDSPRIEVIRITSLVRAELGIEKYKEQYRSRAARAVIKA